MNRMRRKKLTNRDKELKERIRNLRNEILTLREQRQPKSSNWEDARDGRSFTPPSLLGRKRTIMEKDTGTIADLDFGQGNRVMTLSGGAKAIGAVQYWNAASEDCEELVYLPNCWQQTCSIEKEDSSVFAVGGLNNTPLIFDTENLINETNDMDEISVKANVVLNGHTSGVAEVIFQEKDKLLSCADETVRLWNIETGTCITKYIGHTGDVFCIDKHPSQPVVVSGAGDFTARVWDQRELKGTDHMRGQSTLTFDTKSRDVNGVAFFPDGQAFAAALNNSCVYLYDTRASTKLLTFRHESTFNKTGVEQVKFSTSGRLLFVMYANEMVQVFDVAGMPVDKDNEAINENMIPNISQSIVQKAKAISVAPSGSVFGVGFAHKKDTAANLYWPSGRARRR